MAQASSEPSLDQDPGSTPVSPGVLDFSVHHGIVDKPAVWNPDFASGWSPVSGDLSTLRAYVQQGIAFIPAAMTSGHRSSAAFHHTDLAVVDIDHGLSLEAFLAHPLAQCAAYVYTTASHQDAPGLHRFRVLFRLPRQLTDPAEAKAAVTLLVRALGGDKSCTDPCRLYYAFRGCSEPLWQPEAQLPGSFLDDVRAEVAAQQQRYDPSTADYDDTDIARAVFVLEQVIPPTHDGERDLFTRVTAAARSAGSALFPAWSDWASRGHHGKGKNSSQAGERFYQGFRGSSLATLFHLANDADPDWRAHLPEELKRSGSTSFFLTTGVAGYDHEDFMGVNPLLDDEPQSEPVQGAGTMSLFDEAKPWTAPVAPPAMARANDDDPEPDDDDLEPPAAHLVDEGEPVRGRGGQGQGDVIEQVRDRLQRLYPGLRLNSMSLDLEYGPRENPKKINDIGSAYIRISKGANTLFPKVLVTDVAQVMGMENAYHPVRKYLEHCASTAAPCPYFETLATEILGLPDDELTNPVLPNGRRLGDVVMERFMVGAVARIINPGCRHDWMPILIGGQNSGKTTFFQYLTPPDSQDPGTYPWVATIQQGIGYLKERPHALHAGWMVLLDECERYFKRQYTEELKNLVSVPVDRSARKFENERSFPRSFVLCGTANNADFLVDPTGNRRFMPIIVAGKVPSPEDPRIRIIDLDRLKADRDSIWAAAYRAYLDKPEHLFSSYELACINTYMEGFTTDNPTDLRMARLLETRTSGIYQGVNYVTMSDLFLWLDIPLDRQASMQLAVSDSLKRLGHELRRVSIAGQVRRIWTRKTE
jgi:hypothetical protein